MAQDAEIDIPEIGKPESSGGEEKKASAAGGGKLKAIAIQAGIFMALTGAAFGVNLYVLKPMLVVSGKEQAKEPPAKPKTERHAGKILLLDPAIVNIAGTNGRRYLKVTVQIEIPEEEKLVKEVEARKPLLSDRLIQILARKPLEEVTSAGSLEILKRQIADQFGKELGADRLQDVYLTEFVIQ
ncbi:flagellar basal body-associated FliL family protein [Candidatus Methylomirabilis sp.]|uniref:flagellar basal body-associated FliL family protein n=1 Tax=Candidatus Methylomirabilis sp. TaxID=2032687 RepID=UPI002A6195E1|nr:flagellar basal body-associated FliL family protein [Candidatus Methylomirabilis sp.]